MSSKCKPKVLNRKSLLVALATAELVGVASAPQAQSGSVFVPELALIDGAICRTPKVMGALPLLRVAQAAQDRRGKKTGISPAALTATKAVSGPTPDDDPPLMQALGSATMPITTSSKKAQEFFDQGYRLGWGFNHDEARRAFRKAQRLDPECAMCYWGEAWVLGPNINVPMDPAANPPALAALQGAQRLAARATPRERALIAALAARYSPAATADRAKLDADYAAAMRDVRKRFPDDLEIATLYADALMNVSSWDYWEPGGRKLRAPVAELVSALEGVLEKDPDHAGAIHLYIHTVEASEDPRRAEPYADRLAKLAPNAGHLVHMPSHIYFVIGRYKDSLATNLEAVKVDEAYIAAEKPAGVYPLGYYPHNVHFVMVSAQMGGDGKKVVESAEKLGRLIPAEAARDALLLQPVKAAPYYAHAQFSDAATVIALRSPGADLPYVQTAWHYARGVALAQNGDVTGAARELAQIEHLVEETDFTPFALWKIPAKEVAQIAAHVLRARIHQARGNLDGAIDEIGHAISIQDALPYMEPAYWYYPVRQSLGALLLLKGETARARNAFGESLARTPNNAWALFGLAQAYAREGMAREARAVEEQFARVWMGETRHIDLATL